jgi:hypothetical protein
VNEGSPATTARYGWRTHDIDAVAGALSTALGIEFEPHDSLYLGDYYLWPPSRQREGRRAELRLLANFFDEIDQELAYPEYPEHGVLLDATDVPDDWSRLILGLPATELLRRDG